MYLHYRGNPLRKTLNTSVKAAHTPKTQLGMGDFYGTSIKQPLGKTRSSIGTNPISKKKLGKPPKSMA